MAETVRDSPLRRGSGEVRYTSIKVLDCQGKTRHEFEPGETIRFGVAYECRGESSGRGRLSQHALGNAIDIGGFDLSDGTRIDVESDWAAHGPRRDFLRDMGKRACAYFNVVLTPSSDALHRNHFHFDVGPYRLCSAD